MADSAGTGVSDSPAGSGLRPLQIEANGINVIADARAQGPPA